MPEFTWTAIVTSFLAVLGEAAVALLMLRNGYSKQWKALFYFLSYKAVTELAITCAIISTSDIRLREELYFYSFWAAKIGEIFLQYWVLWQIVEKLLPRTDRIQCIGFVSFVIAAAANLAVSATCSAHANMLFYLRVTRFALHAETATSLAWCLTFLLVTFLSGLVGILWRTEMLFVASGFALHVAVRMLAVWAASMHIPDRAASILSSSDIGFLLPLVLWAYYFRIRRNGKKIDMELADEIRGDLKALRAMDV